MLKKQVAWTFLIFQLSCVALKPLDLATINESRNLITLEDGTTTLGLQNALDRNYPYQNNTIAVFLHACNQTDGTHNCTAACQSNSTKLSDLETLHNCAVLPEISVNLAKDNVTANARSIAQKLNIQSSNDEPSLPSDVSNQIQNCLIGSCKADSDCNKKLNHSNSNRQTQYKGTSFVTDDDYFSLCHLTTAYVDADVGGIGVFISYVVEMGLALIAFVLTIPWLSIAKGLRASFLSGLRLLSRRRGSRKSSQRTQTSSSRKITPYYDALTSALVGFHKAQCWFMLATNIAGLIVKKSGGLDPDSLQQLYNTYVFIKVIAIGGFLPITFSLLNLHMIQKLSWYPITLSIATIAVAIATLKSGGSSFTPTTDDFESITSKLSQEPVDFCGSQNLLPLCYYPRRDDSFGFNASSNGSSADDILIFCLITLAIILIDHFCRSDDEKQQRLNRRLLKRLGVDPSKALFPHAVTVLRYGTPAFHFVFFWLYIYCFYLFAEDLNWFAANDVYDPGWGFGQIVAVAVWLPTLFDFAWDLSRGGVEKGSEHKLPRMYEVVKKVQRGQKVAGTRRELEMESEHKVPYHNLRDGGTRDEEDGL